MRYSKTNRPALVAMIAMLIAVLTVETAAGNPETDTCNNHGAAAEDVPVAPRTLTADDEGSIIEVDNGDTLRVDLTFQGGTGYQWYPDGLDGTLLRLDEVRTESVSNGPETGSEMHGSWYFKVLGAGKTELRMLYYREWEGKEEALDGFSVTLHIK